jgi:hypothetical protein
MDKLYYERADYSVVVKNRAPPPKAWRWEIYQTRMCRFPASGSSWESLAHGGADDTIRDLPAKMAGNVNPIKQSSVYFDTTAAARRAGKEALNELLNKLFA